MPKLAYIKTFGCQMNEHDSSKMRLCLRGLGFGEAASMEDADLVILNTCTIREKASHKAISEMGRARVLKLARPGTVVGVAGCVAQEMGDQILERFCDIDFVFGPDQIWRLP